jgi:hypothetical protein
MPGRAHRECPDALIANARTRSSRMPGRAHRECPDALIANARTRSSRMPGRAHRECPDSIAGAAPETISAAPLVSTKASLAANLLAQHLLPQRYRNLPCPRFGRQGLHVALSLSLAWEWF